MSQVHPAAGDSEALKTEVLRCAAHAAPVTNGGPQLHATDVAIVEAAEAAGGEQHETYNPHESPPVMTWPLILLAVGSVAAGGFLILGERFQNFYG